MKTSDHQWEFLQDVAWLINYAKEMGYKLTGGELYRTEFQHQYNIEHGLTKAKRSNHQDRLAIDFNLFIDGKVINDKKHPAWVGLGVYWEGMNKLNRWGGNFTSINDPYHFERNL
jgi:hypothetical protein